MAGELAGKVAVITGGANGLGRATAQLFVEEGAKVVVGDVDESGAELEREIGASCRFLRTDVTDRNQVQALVDLAVNHFGRIDVMCNNAGRSAPMSRILEGSFDEFDGVMKVNVLGVMLGTQIAGRYMVKSGGGSIINTSSIAGVLASHGVSVYRSSKAAVIQFTKTAAIELAQYDIRVNCLVPGQIDTQLIRKALSSDVSPEKLDRYEAAVRKIMETYQPLKQRGQPRDAANVTMFLASDRAAYMTGSVVTIDGGITAGDATDYIAKYAEARRQLDD